MDSETNHIEYKQELIDDLEKEVVTFLSIRRDNLYWKEKAVGVLDFLV